MPADNATGNHGANLLQLAPMAVNRNRTRVEPGIRSDSMGYEAAVKVAGRIISKRFPKNTSLAQMRRWRNEQETRMKYAALNGKAPAAKLLKRSPDGWCYLYVIMGENVVKIGRATNPNERLRELQTGHHIPLKLVAAVPAHADLEAAVHKKFAHLKMSGEWFGLTDALANFIERLQVGHNPIALLWGDL
jgi:hypothetical protein